MSVFFASLSNRARTARLAVRHPRFAAAIARRRLWERAMAVAPGRNLMPGRPVEVVVALTSRCQLACGMCGIRRVMARPPYRGSALAYPDLAPALDEAASWRPRPYFKFTGGEPMLLGEDLFRILAHCRQAGLPARLSTNGVALADPEAARKLVRTGVDVVTVSLDGPAHVHNTIRGRKFAFDRTVAGIRNLGREKAAHTGRTPLVQVSTVIHAGNSRYVEKVHDLCRALPVDWWNVQLLNFVSSEAGAEADELAEQWDLPPGPWNAFDNPELRDFDPADMCRAVDRIKRRNTPFVISFLRTGGFDAKTMATYHAGSESPLLRKRCPAPFLSMHVVPTGDMVFCIDYPYVVYGNVRTHGLEQGWRSSGAKRFRRMVLEEFNTRGRPLPQCNRCNWMFN
ncbi:MAG: radical SAM/SPASM domain-containing protein [Desulfatibacillaceae bacterium]